MPGPVTLNLDPRKIRSPRNKYFGFVVKNIRPSLKKKVPHIFCVYQQPLPVNHSLSNSELESSEVLAYESSKNKLET